MSIKINVKPLVKMYIYRKFFRVTLIKSISGIRGTIGGKPGDGLTPLDVVKFASAYGIWVLKNNPKVKSKIVVGRDARLSGQMVNNIVCGTLNGLGIEIIDVGLSTTPTVELYFN
jgi:phosphomannomutase